MMVDERQDELARLHFHPRAALYSGLVVGAIFLAVSRGSIPWGSIGFPTHVMGRPFPEGVSAEAFAVRTFLQMLLSVLYAFAVAGVVYRLKAFPAAFAGAAIGLVLYGLNYLVFRFVLGVSDGGESPAIITHVVYCLIVAATYKGFSIPRAEMEPRTNP